MLENILIMIDDKIAEFYTKGGKKAEYILLGENEVEVIIKGLAQVHGFHVSVLSGSTYNGLKILEVKAKSHLQVC